MRTCGECIWFARNNVAYVPGEYCTCPVPAWVGKDAQDDCDIRANSTCANRCECFDVIESEEQKS